MTLWTKGVRTVAIVVGAKGLLGFLGAFLVISIGHHEVVGNDFVEKLLAFAHVHPDGLLARWIAPYLEGFFGKIHDHRTLLAGVGFGYGTLKIVEGIGLWFEQRWAEWLVLVSTAMVFIPIEVAELMHRVTWMRVGALILSLIIIGFMAAVLYHSRKKKDALREKSKALQGSVSS